MDTGFVGRRLGRSEVVLSTIALGTMRLAESGAGVDEVARLFDCAVELGVDTLHSSREYESFPLLVEVLRRTRHPFRHIVKLADPHFDEPRFDARRFRQRFDDYLRLLATDRIDVVQWMCRAHVDDVDCRRVAMRSVTDALPDLARSLRDGGKLGALVAFPYRMTDVDDLLRRSWCDGFTLYLNAAELDYAGRLDEIDTSGQGVIALRPFYAGRLLSAGDARVDQHLRLALSHPSVTATVVSSSSSAHLGELVRIAADITRDRAAFDRLVAASEPRR